MRCMKVNERENFSKSQPTRKTHRNAMHSGIRMVQQHNAFTNNEIRFYHAEIEKENESYCVRNFKLYLKCEPTIQFRINSLFDFGVFVSKRNRDYFTKQFVLISFFYRARFLLPLVRFPLFQPEFR